jgi:hypothetical protein
MTLVADGESGVPILTAVFIFSGGGSMTDEDSKSWRFWTAINAKLPGLDTSGSPQARDVGRRCVFSTGFKIFKKLINTLRKHEYTNKKADQVR